MKKLVVYYSLSGNTRTLATVLARDLAADTEELHCPRYASGVWGYMRAGYDSWKGNLPPIEKLPLQYELVVVAGPIWAFHPATPVRNFLKQERSRLPRVAFLLTHGGSAGERSDARRLSGRALLARNGGDRGPGAHCHVNRAPAGCKGADVCIRTRVVQGQTARADAARDSSLTTLRPAVDANVAPKPCAAHLAANISNGPTRAAHEKVPNQPTSCRRYGTGLRSQDDGGGFLGIAPGLRQGTAQWLRPELRCSISRLGARCGTPLSNSSSIDGS